MSLTFFSVFFSFHFNSYSFGRFNSLAVKHHTYIHTAIKSASLSTSSVVHITRNMSRVRKVSWANSIEGSDTSSIVDTIIFVEGPICMKYYRNTKSLIDAYIEYIENFIERTKRKQNIEFYRKFKWYENESKLIDNLNRNLIYLKNYCDFEWHVHGEISDYNNNINNNSINNCGIFARLLNRIKRIRKNQQNSYQNDNCNNHNYSNHCCTQFSKDIQKELIVYLSSTRPLTLKPATPTAPSIYSGKIANANASIVIPDPVAVAASTVAVAAAAVTVASINTHKPFDTVMYHDYVNVNVHNRKKIKDEYNITTNATTTTSSSSSSSSDSTAIADSSSTMLPRQKPNKTIIEQMIFFDVLNDIILALQGQFIEPTSYIFRFERYILNDKEICEYLNNLWLNVKGYFRRCRSNIGRRRETTLMWVMPKNEALIHEMYKHHTSYEFFNVQNLIKNQIHTYRTLLCIVTSGTTFRTLNNSITYNDIYTFLENNKKY